MKIAEKLEEKRSLILENKTGIGKTFAEKIRRDGIAAIVSGMKTATGQTTPEWETLMMNFTDDPQELARLCGKETAFNKSDWGIMCLAYIAANSTCTFPTTDSTGTMGKFTPEMKENLDQDIFI